MAAGLLALSGLLAFAAAAEDEARLLAYGRHLAHECSACHRLDGADRGIPSITGWDAEKFSKTLEFYRTGARMNPVMVSVAKSLDDQQVRALAVYYATLPSNAEGKQRQTGTP
jgi:cytochrome c553